MSEVLNNTKFTPGQWEVQPASIENGEPLYYSIMISGNSFINSYENKFIPCSIKQAEANARLIAAAPKMYDILEKIHKSFTTDGTLGISPVDVRELLKKINQ